MSYMYRIENSQLRKDIERRDIKVSFFFFLPGGAPSPSKKPPPNCRCSCPVIAIPPPLITCLTN